MPQIIKAVERMCCDRKERIVKKIQKCLNWAREKMTLNSQVTHNKLMISF